MSSWVLIKQLNHTVTAGGDTTLGFVQYFIYTMLMYPDVQKKAQEELDRVVGRDRLPTIAEWVFPLACMSSALTYSYFSYPDLPYLNALVQEVHRWRPVAPMAIPHALSKDDVYKGRSC